MNILFLPLIFVLLSFSLEAKTTTKRVSGFGLSKQKAVTNALIEAVSQVKGVQIESVEVMKSKFSEASVSHNGSNDEITSASDQSASAVSKITKGIVQSYDVIKVSKASRGYEAIVDVHLAVYKAPGLSTKNRRKIAVMPFYISKSSYYIAGKSYSGLRISDMLSQALTTNLTQARKFAVVDRSYTRQMSGELNLVASSQTPLSEKVKLGQKLGADYLLVGTIQEANMHSQVARNQLLGTSSSKNIAEFIIDYRIIVVGSSQVKWSDTQKAVVDLTDNQSSFDMALQNAVETVSQEITNSLLGNIYPIRVLQITPVGDIVLNQGGNSLHVGMRMNVMRQGKKMYDPYTKESLGYMEKKVAEIEITNVTAKISYAKAIDTSSSVLKKNDICRRQANSKVNATQEVKDDPRWRKTNVQVNPSGGGVRLPFD